MSNVSITKRVLLTLALLVGVSLPTVLHAAPAAAAGACSGSEDTTWTGAIDSDFSNAGNWNNGLPAGGRTACIGGTATNDDDFTSNAFTDTHGSTVHLVFAALQPTGVTGHVFIDDNDNGSLQAGETTAPTGLELYVDLDGNYQYDAGEPSTTVASDGSYTMAAPSGTYHVFPKLRNVWSVTSGSPVTANIPSSGSVTTDFSVYRYGRVHGVVFDDRNANGVQDSGEPGLGGVIVYHDLDRSNSYAYEPFTTTAADGSYELYDARPFQNPISYLVQAPNGYRETTAPSAPVTIAHSGTDVLRTFGLTTQPVGYTPPPVAAAGPQDPASQGTGYWLIGADGGVYPYGQATNLGAPKTLPSLNAPIVSITANPAGGGYWALGADGGVFSYGTASFFGSTASIKLNEPIANIAPTPSGNGYWLLGQDGGVFAYGGAFFKGSAANDATSNAVAMASTPDGAGYWLATSNGGVFSYGNAPFAGSMGGTQLAAPIVNVAATGDGKGYYLVAADGGVFAFGTATFHGSHGGSPLASPIVSIRTKADGSGYVLVAADGGVFAYGTDQFLGSPAGAITAPVVQ